MANKIDYSFKSYILNNYQKMLIAERKASMFSYSQYLLKNYGIITYSMKQYKKGNFAETFIELEDYCKSTNLLKEFKECVKINHAHYARIARLKDRITNILQLGCCSFITLTFNNEVFKTTSIETRRRYVARWCKSFGVPYVANIDYGKHTDREHYHCVLGCVPSCKTWSYGFIDIESIKKTNKNNVVCLSKYVAKLSNHAIKETTKRSVLLYSR